MRALGERGNVLCRVPELAERHRRADVGHERGERLGEVLAAEQSRRLSVALGCGRLRETKGSGRGDRDRETVRDEGVIRRVAGRRPGVLQRRDRVGAGMGDVDARASEADPGHRRGEHHRAPRFGVASVGDRSAEEPAS